MKTYVTMTDKLLSSDNNCVKVIATCANLKEAGLLADYARTLPYMKGVDITTIKPTYVSDKVSVRTLSEKDRESWLRNAREMINSKSSSEWMGHTRKVNVGKDGTLYIVGSLSISDSDMRELISKIIYDAGNKYSKEEVHNRWTILYNGYDLKYDTDIRRSHNEYMEDHGEISRIDYVLNTGMIRNLFYATVKLYPGESERILSKYAEKLI